MGNMGGGKSAKQLIKFAENIGYAVSRTGGNHLRFTHPKVTQPVIASSTPSCRFGHENCKRMLIRKLREIGISVDNHGNIHDEHGRII